MLNFNYKATARQAAEGALLRMLLLSMLLRSRKLRHLLRMLLYLLRMLLQPLHRRLEALEKQMNVATL